MYNENEKRLINQIENVKKIKFIVKCKYLDKYYIIMDIVTDAIF